MDLWTKIKSLEGRVLETTSSQRKPFLVEAVREKSVIIRPKSTEVKRYVSRAHIENVAAAGPFGAHLTPTAAIVSAPGSQNTSYIVAILRAVR